MESIIKQLKQYYGTYREMAKALEITEASIHNARKGQGGHILNEFLRMKLTEITNKSK